MTPPLLTLCQQVLEASEKATPGPWRIGRDSVQTGMNRLWDDLNDDVCCCEGDGSKSEEETHANENFIALSRTALPRLAKDVMMLVEALKKIADGSCHDRLKEHSSSGDCGDEMCEIVEAKAALKAVGVEEVQ